MLETAATAGGKDVCQACPMRSFGVLGVKQLELPMIAPNSRLVLTVLALIF